MQRSAPLTRKAALVAVPLPASGTPLRARGRVWQKANGLTPVAAERVLVGVATVRWHVTRGTTDRNFSAHQLVEHASPTKLFVDYVGDACEWIANPPKIAGNFVYSDPHKSGGGRGMKAAELGNAERHVHPLRSGAFLY